MLTNNEHNVIMSLVNSWNLYLKLPKEHADDDNEFRTIIHAAQDKILARAARREINIT